MGCLYVVVQEFLSSADLLGAVAVYRPLFHATGTSPRRELFQYALATKCLSLAESAITGNK